MKRPFLTELDKAYYRTVIREKWHNTKKFVRDNKEVLAVAIPVAASACGWLIKTAAKQHNLQKEEHLKNDYCYDRSLGHYWELNRKLTNSEWLRIENRKKEGEGLGEILRDMRVLK